MSPTSDRPIQCAVEGADKLPAEIGGEPAICATIAAAVLPALERSGVSPSAVSLSVRVKSDSHISTVASISGTRLAEQNVAISDRALTSGAIDMLAQALAAELSRDGK